MSGNTRPLRDSTHVHANSIGLSSTPMSGEEAMDPRRPIRSNNTTGARRGLFAAPSRRQNPTTAPAPSIPTDADADVEEADEDALVDKDASGNYTVAGPPTSLKLAVCGVKEVVDEQAEHDKQLIAMYGKHINSSQARSNPLDPAFEAEVKAALDRSLKENVRSLEEDAWMFEPEKLGKMP